MVTQGSEMGREVADVDGRRLGSISKFGWVGPTGLSPSFVHVMRSCVCLSAVGILP